MVLLMLMMRFVRVGVVDVAKSADLLVDLVCVMCLLVFV